MSIDYIQIGHRIQTARKEKQLTQERLAEELSVSVGYISQLERGITKISLERLERVSSLLGYDITFFLIGCLPQNDSYLKQEIISVWNELTPDKRRALLAIAEVIKQNL